MSKNIILCSDGTGNEGGTTPDSNVFRMYKSIMLNTDKSVEVSKKQITFYDNGVGTSKVSILRGLGGGMGWGFEQNVKDLYEFLGRNYEEGDDIYIFGFSRGAATVRAFAGMLEHCGLVVKKQQKLSEDDYKKLIDEAMKAYKKGKLEKDKDGRITDRHYPEADAFRKKNAYVHNDNAPDGKLKIEFMGIWDTVASLGTPQLPWIDKIINIGLHHFAYDLEPQNCVKNVCHAVAVDDERRTFWPLIWDETTFVGNIEQVWFPGMHSNVGGGYNRQELATVTLDWMMEKLLYHAENKNPPQGGLLLKADARKNAQSDANPFGKLHDSRSGGGIFYRYQPRPIERICAGRLKEKIKIHISVIRRMRKRTGGYIPLNIPKPGEFEVSYTRKENSIKSNPTANNSQKEIENYAGIREQIDKFKDKRITLYWIFLMSVLSLVLAALCIWSSYTPLSKEEMDAWRGAAWSPNWYLGHVSDILNYFLPDIFAGIIWCGVNQNPQYFLGLVIYAIILGSYRKSLRYHMEHLQEEARIKLLQTM